jgi:hypothetical protein
VKQRRADRYCCRDRLRIRFGRCSSVGNVSFTSLALFRVLDDLRGRTPDGFDVLWQSGRRRGREGCRN